MFVIDSAANEVQKSTWANWRGAQLLLAPTSSIAFQRLFNRLQAPHRRKIEKGTLDPQVSLEISCQAMSEAIILDWKGFVDKDKKEVVYSKEVANALLLKMPDLREFVQEYSLDIENFRAEETEEMGKS